MNETSSIVDLLFKRLTEELTDAEESTLQQWVESSPQHRSFLLEISDEDQLRKAVLASDNEVRQARHDRILLKINDGISSRTATVQRIHFLKTTWARYAAAILILLGVGSIYYWNASRRHTPNESASVVKHANDVFGGSARPILTLANGEQIRLDSHSRARLNTLGIAQETSTISYSNKGTGNAWNTLTTPKGAEHAIRLADGTMAWLNAESSITYPEVFANNVREVKVTGEVYFDVAKDAKKPFRVSANGMAIEILGTSFDIKAYDNEPISKVTLADGAVRVITTMKADLLSPGDQFQKYSDNKQLVQHQVNLQEATAWKRGLFHFDSADLQSILREFARWYDIEVVFQDAVSTEKFFLIINRNSSLQAVLDALQASNVHFTLEGKKLIVKAVG